MTEIQLSASRHDLLRARALADLQAVKRMDRAALDSLQRDRLAASLEHAATRSPFYRARRDRGLLATDPARLAEAPFTTKDDLRAAYPLGLLAAPPEDLVRYGESTGTTGAPTSAYITFGDWIGGNVWVEDSFRTFFQPGETVFVALPYELTFASYDIDRALETVGATVVPVGALNQVCPFDRMVAMVRTLKPACVVCTPTRMLRIHDMLVQGGHDPRAVGLNKLFVVGETCSAAKLRRLADLLGVSRVINAYGSTETNSLALPCPLGHLHLVEDRYLFEVVDPDSGAAVGPGRRGELVLTSLMSQAMPLLRYRTGDLVTVEPTPCACGDARRVLRHHGRVSERFEVAGQRIPRIDLEDILLSVDNTELHYVAETRDGVLHVGPVLTDPARTATCDEIAARITAVWDVPLDVRPVEAAAVFRAMDRMLKPGSLTLADVEAVS
jgi:phenylacetate-CoA ligase